MSMIQECFEFSEKVEVMCFSNTSSIGAYIGEKVPSWIKGVACCKNRVLLVYPPVREVYSDESTVYLKIFLHEYIHLAINKTFKGECPYWLNEGLAIFFSGQVDDMSKIPLSGMGNPYSLDYENDFFYEFCGCAVQALCNKYGEKSLIKYIKDCKDFINDIRLGKESLRMLFDEEEGRI